MLLGGWWLAAAAQGLLPSLPVINLEPVMEGEEARGQRGAKSPTRRVNLHPQSPTRKAPSSGSGSSKFSNSS